MEKLKHIMPYAFWSKNFYIGKARKKLKVWGNDAKLGYDDLFYSVFILWRWDISESSNFVFFFKQY